MGRSRARVCEKREGEEAGREGAAPLRGILPPAAVLERTRALRSGAGWEEEHRSEKEARACALSTSHLPLSGLLCYDVPGCGPGGFISFLPPCDNNGHCLRARSRPASWTLSLHCVISPSRPPWKAGWESDLSFPWPGCRPGVGGSPHPPALSP